MSPINFCYWLQGFFEINEKNNQLTILNESSIKTIKDHLQLVFKTTNCNYIAKEVDAPVSELLTYFTSPSC